MLYSWYQTLWVTLWTKDWYFQLINDHRDHVLLDGLQWPDHSTGGEPWIVGLWDAGLYSSLLSDQPHPHLCYQCASMLEVRQEKDKAKKNRAEKSPDLTRNKHFRSKCNLYHRPTKRNWAHLCWNSWQKSPQIKHEFREFLIRHEPFYVLWPQ